MLGSLAVSIPGLYTVPSHQTPNLSDGSTARSPPCCVRAPRPPLTGIACGHLAQPATFSRLPHPHRDDPAALRINRLAICLDFSPSAGDDARQKAEAPLGPPGNAPLLLARGADRRHFPIHPMSRFSALTGTSHTSLETVYSSMFHRVAQRQFFLVKPGIHMY